jgi:ubiquinone/menaquinone biosynthesis C-methylase UbiE
MNTSSARQEALDEARGHWDSISAGWLRWQDVFERGGVTVTEQLIELGAVGAGDRVLDVGTGLGEPALTLARTVGPSGSVVGIDLSPQMIKLARERADGVSNVEFVEADPVAYESDEPFDAVVSRWCLMLLPDRDAVLRSLRQLIRPGGVFTAAVWGPPEKAPMISLAFPVLAKWLDLPPPSADQPGPFTMADAQQCRTEVTAAGFGPVSVVAVEAPFWMDSPEDYARFALDVLPERFQQMLRDRLGSLDDPRIWDKLVEKAAEFVHDDRVVLTSRTFCVRGVAPPG